MTTSLRFSKSRQNGPFLAFLISFYLSTQDANVARFDRNVEGDFLGDFQTLFELFPHDLNFWQSFYLSLSSKSPKLLGHPCFCLVGTLVVK